VNQVQNWVAPGATVPLNHVVWPVTVADRSVLPAAARASSRPSDPTGGRSGSAAADADGADAADADADAVKPSNRLAATASSSSTTRAGVDFLTCVSPRLRGCGTWPKVTRRGRGGIGMRYGYLGGSVPKKSESAY
jgi:hypothetical protein